jgi:hypothetical protein
MTPDELQQNFFSAVLYYVSVNGDSTLYNTDLSNLGTYDSDPITGYYYMTTWVPTGYPMPANSDMEAYSVADVTNFFNSYYAWPSGIKSLNQQAFYQLSNAQISATVVDSTFTGYIVYNTDSQKLVRYTGSTWVGLW